jgi:lon-related putative ATP-dependent protease
LHHEVLPPAVLRRSCDPASLPFETTDALEDLDYALGQERAVEAIRFGVGIRRQGYNLFALGPTGTGKHYIIRQSFAKIAAGQPTPPDWCYVHNFKDPYQPRPLRLPTGKATPLREDLKRFIEDARAVLEKAFSAKDYLAKRRKLEDKLKRQQEKAIDVVKKDAEKNGIAIMIGAGGVTVAPLDGEDLMDDEAYKALPKKDRERLEERLESYQGKLEEALRLAPQWEQELRDGVRALDRELAGRVLGPMFKDLLGRWAELTEVAAYLEEVRADLTEHAAELIEDEEDEEDEAPKTSLASMMGEDEVPVSRRYLVHVMVDHSQTSGAPVVYEDWPTVYRLMGRVEHRTEMGALETDFTLIRAGALHRANGGYLVLDAEQVLQQPHSWEQLKRALRSRQIRTGSLEQLLDRATVISLDPLPIPLEVKVILLGERGLYYDLAYEDPEFPQLFKIAADFNEEIPRTPEDELLFARLVASLVRHHKLRPMGKDAVAKVIEHAVRVAEDSSKISIHIQSTSDLLKEADYLAEAQGRALTTADDIQEALRGRRWRGSRARERDEEDIRRGVVLIDTEGAAVGQINGLSVMQLGQVAFGRPFRITASWRVGVGEVVDIEREVDLGGPLHSKGVMIITGYLGGRYARNKTLSLNASLAMEQSYGEVDGDSASLAELCALLSALSGVPLRQGLAMTGSVNQYGRVQAIGGVNEKIEGFYDVCAARGLAGYQGVIIPASNVPHLMLREDVAEAAAQGRFHIYAVKTVDEALEILTGQPAGVAAPDGTYPEGSIHRLVDDQLTRLAHIAQKAKG